MQITVDLLRRFAGPQARAPVLDGIVATAPVVLSKYGITTPLRMAHFFAQIAHESGGFRIVEENLNYSATRLQQVWPNRFPDAATAQRYARNPQALANNVYANRMGNGPSSSGDGWKYRGRGLAQLTGKDGYAQVARITGLPLVERPELAAEPAAMLECAAGFWKWKGLAALADRDDVAAVTRRWNGGTIGLADRIVRLKKAKLLFIEPLDAAPVPVPVPEPPPSLPEAGPPVAAIPPARPPAGKTGSLLAAILAGLTAIAAFARDYLPAALAVVITLTMGTIIIYRIRKGYWPWPWTRSSSTGARLPAPSLLSLPELDRSSVPVSAHLEDLSAVLRATPSPPSSPSNRPRTRSARPSRPTRRRPTSSSNSKRSAVSKSSRRHRPKSSG